RTPRVHAVQEGRRRQVREDRRRGAGHDLQGQRMTLTRVAVVVLLAGCVASAPATAQLRLIVPSAASLDNPRPRQLVNPDTLPNQNSIETLPPPTPLPPLTQTVPFDVSCLNDKLRAAFPTSTVRLGFVGNHLVLTGHA